MTARRSRGAETQRIAAEWYRANGFPFCTDAGAGRSGRDLLNMIGLAPEVKGRADFHPLAWSRQAARNAAGDVPFVLLRCNGQGPAAIAEWPVIVPNLHWTQVIRAAGFRGAAVVTEGLAYRCAPCLCLVCNAPATWTSLYTGRRCDEHAPSFDPMTAVRILMAGWPGLAAAYVRLWDADPLGRQAAA
jgi:hypothetical protein